jgi:hypothetical protein
LAEVLENIQVAGMFGTSSALCAVEFPLSCELQPM